MKDCKGCAYESGKEYLQRCRDCCRWPIRSDLYITDQYKQHNDKIRLSELPQWDKR